MSTKNKNRIKWIDTAKGIGILLVVLFHMPVKEMTLAEFWGGYIVLFYMIFFFMLSAIFYKPDNIQKRLSRLMIPYIVFYVIGFALYALKTTAKHGQIDWGSFLLPFIGATEGYENTPVWFLLSLSEISILSILLIRYVPKRYVVPSSWLVGFAGFLLGSYSITNIYYIGSSLTALPFFVTAFQYRDIITERRPVTVYFFCIVLSFLLFLLRPYWCNLSQNYVPVGYVLFVSISLFASYGLTGLCQYIREDGTASKVLGYLGRNSLIILCTHFYFITIPYILQSCTDNLWLSNGFGLLLIILLEIPVIELVNRKLPFFIGK